ncbi:MAG TPA: tyrosine-type recombinase/integrase [Ohtaekwangia sp.]|nr:tyrosine-type recombinase/integrase [Ohtaekwangia sp.]
MIDSFLKYLQYERRVSPHTVLAYRNDLEQFASYISSTFPDNTIKDVEYGIVRAWIIQLVEQQIEPRSVNRKIASLRTFYKFLMRQEIITKNPMLKIRVLKTSRKLPGFVKEGDMTTMLDGDGFDQSLEGLRNKLILELFYGTGIRLSELLTLKECDVDIKKRTIKVLGKRNKERVIPFSASLVSVLEDYRSLRNRTVSSKDHGLLLVTDQGEACYSMMIYRLVKKYLGTYTSSDKKSPHVLRHTYATHLLDKGAEINAVKDLLGHSSLAATQVYTHNSMEKLKKAFDQAHPKA